MGTRLNVHMCASDWTNHAAPNKYMLGRKLTMDFTMGINQASMCAHSATHHAVNMDFTIANDVPFK